MLVAGKKNEIVKTPPKPEAPDATRLFALAKDADQMPSRKEKIKAVKKELKSKGVAGDKGTGSKGDKSKGPAVDKDMGPTKSKAKIISAASPSTDELDPPRSWKHPTVGDLVAVYGSQKSYALWLDSEKKR
ncbi:unnamed protein product, partial [Prorocentrum cordatum]